MKNIVKKLAAGLMLCSIMVYSTVPVFAYTKDETVYSKVDSTGNSYKTIVTEHLENLEKSEKLTDSSNLSDIKNTSGDEECSQNGYTLVWNANGNDIYYQGTTEEKLPIETKVTYKLDGKEMAADEIAGKKGRVEINIEYANTESQDVELNGKTVKMYQPFIVICGTYMKNSENKNIEITNGKAIDDGTKTILMGYSVPGMQETLGIEKETLEIPSSVQISLDTDCFELNNIITYIQPVNLDSEDIDFSETLEDLYSEVDSLQSASEQLESGANTLRDGTITYSEKSQEFTSAVGEISDGANTLSSSYSKIDSGISSINSNLSTVQSGMQSLQSGEDELLSGLDQIIAAVNSEVSSMDTTELTQLKAANDSAYANLEKANSALESNVDALKNSLELVTDEEEIATINAQISTLQTQIDANASIMKLLLTNSTAYETIINTLSSSSDSLSTLSGYLNNLRAGIVSLQDGTDKLSNGISQLSQGANTLQNGSSQVKSGLSTLSSGGSQLLDASNQLTDGAISIQDGAITLADGIEQFNREGIDKICNFINSDVKDVTNRLEKLQELSYNNFTMLDEETESSDVRFITISDKIEKDDSDNSVKKEEAILNDDESSSKEEN